MRDQDLREHQDKVQALALLTRQQVDFMFGSFPRLTWRGIQITGYTHWAALEEMLSEKSHAAYFSVADCMHAMQKRWPDHEWPWKFVAKTFQVMVNDGNLQKHGSKNGCREVLYSVTENYKDTIRAYYLNTMRTAELLLANQRVEQAMKDQARCQARWQGQVAASLPATRADLFNSASPFSGK